MITWYPTQDYDLKKHRIAAGTEHHLVFLSTDVPSLSKTEAYALFRLPSMLGQTVQRTVTELGGSSWCQLVLERHNEWQRSRTER